MRGEGEIKKKDTLKREVKNREVYSSEKVIIETDMRKKNDVNKLKESSYCCEVKKIEEDKE